MIDKAPDTKYGIWSSTEAGLNIEYPLELLDEVRLAVCSGFDRTTRGGVGTGGVFFGSRNEGLQRLAIWRPIPCEHSRGTSFVLSDKDREGLRALLEAAKSDTELASLEILGWFISHPGGDPAPAEEDLEIYREFFPEPWQFIMALRPGRADPTLAAIFARGSDGHLHGSDTNPFVLAPLRRARGRGASHLPELGSPRIQEKAPPVTPPARERPLALGAMTSIVPQQAKAPQPALDESDEGDRRWLRWLWAIPVVVALAVAGWLLTVRYFEPPPASGLALRLQDSPGSQLHIDWDRDSRAIQVAQRGLLEISDDGQARNFDLDAEQLQKGTFTYVRRSGNVRVKLRVVNVNDVAHPVEEIAQFVGAAADDPPAAHENPPAWQKEKTDLESQIKQLRVQVATESAKNKQQEDVIRVLETRLGIAGKK